MAATDEDDGPSQGPKCFVISAFGQSPDEQRMHKQVLKHLIRKVLTPRGYDVKRADEIADEGLITNQIIERLLDDDLVIADLTGLNPNVFYEMAVRHAARKPIVHLVTAGVDIPFDVANMRAIPYLLTDPDQLEAAQAELEEKVAAIEGSGFEAASNPITSARNVAILRKSEQPDARETGDLLHAFGQVQDEVRRLARQIDANDERGDSVARRIAESHAMERFIRKALAASRDGLTVQELADFSPFPPRWLIQELNTLSARNQIHRDDNGRWTVPAF